MRLDMHREARRFEDALAEDLVARRIFLSGAGHEKADVRRRRGYTVRDGCPVPLERLALRIEAKTTSRLVYTMRTVDWSDLVRAADQAGEHPVFAVRFLRWTGNVDTVLVRRGLAEQLELAITDTAPVRINRSTTLTYDRYPRLLIPHHSTGVPRPPDEVVSVPYPKFLEGVAYAEESTTPVQAIDEPAKD